jgi:hypothetical protein
MNSRSSALHRIASRSGVPACLQGSHGRHSGAVAQNAGAARPGRLRKACSSSARIERFQAKWRPVRVKKTRQIKDLEPCFDSIETERALEIIEDGAIETPTEQDSKFRLPNLYVEEPGKLLTGVHIALSHPALRMGTRI